MDTTSANNQNHINGVKPTAPDATPQSSVPLPAEKSEQEEPPVMSEYEFLNGPSLFLEGKVATESVIFGCGGSDITFLRYCGVNDAGVVVVVVVFLLWYKQQ